MSGYPDWSISYGEKGVAYGVATLGSDGKLTSGQLPSLAITSVSSVADITARDALSADAGDVAIVTDIGDGTSATYIYNGSGWTELLFSFQNASQTVFDPVPSGMAALNVQDAIEELDGRLDGLGDLSAGDDASDISYDDTLFPLGETNVQDAVNKLSEIKANSSDLGTMASKNTASFAADLYPDANGTRNLGGIGAFWASISTNALSLAGTTATSITGTVNGSSTSAQLPRADAVWTAITGKFSGASSSLMAADGSAVTVSTGLSLSAGALTTTGSGYVPLYSSLLTATTTITFSTDVTGTPKVLRWTAQAPGGGGGGVGTTSGLGRGGGGGPGGTRTGATVIPSNCGKIVVTVGTAGAGGATGANAGGTGGDVTIAFQQADGTPISTICTAKGGTGGGASTGADDGTNGAVGAGGSGGSQLSLTLAADIGSNATMMRGGCTIYGLSNFKSPDSPSGGDGKAGSGYGSGGSGGFQPSGTTARAGGNGAGGMVLLEISGVSA